MVKLINRVCAGFVVGGLLACSSGGGDTKVSNASDNAEQAKQESGQGPVRILKSPAPASAVIRPAAEPIAILEQMISKQKSVLEAGLVKAEKLESKLYPTGDDIKMSACVVIQAQVAKNYPLHSYEVQTDKFETRSGISLCGNDQSLRGNRYVTDQAISLYIGEVISSTGLKATKVVTLGYSPTLSDLSHAPMREQFLIDSKNRVIEHQEYRAFKSNDVWEVVAAMTPEGDVIGRVAREPQDPAQPYVWKGAVTFVAGDGSVDGLRTRQNDGKGVQGSLLMLDAPLNVQWAAFEVSPVTRIDGIYKVGDEIGARLKSKLVYQVVNKAGADCANGHIGYNKDGNSLREFGDIKCQENFDLNRTIH